MTQLFILSIFLSKKKKSTKLGKKHSVHNITLYKYKYHLLKTQIQVYHIFSKDTSQKHKDRKYIHILQKETFIDISTIKRYNISIT